MVHVKKFTILIPASSSKDANSAIFPATNMVERTYYKFPEKGSLVNLLLVSLIYINELGIQKLRGLIGLRQEFAT